MMMTMKCCVCVRKTWMNVEYTTVIVIICATTLRARTAAAATRAISLNQTDERARVSIYTAVMYRYNYT